VRDHARGHRRYGAGLDYGVVLEHAVHRSHEAYPVGPVPRTAQIPVIRRGRPQPRPYWQMYVLVFQAERANFFVPLQEQQAPLMSELDIFVQALEQLPAALEPTSFKP
jgi:hypothetical protein